MLDCRDFINDFKSEDLISIALKSNVSILTLALIKLAAFSNVGPTMLQIKLNIIIELLIFTFYVD